MIQKIEFPKTTLKGVKVKQGITMEQKMQRIMDGNESDDDGTELTFTEEKDGVKPEFDIRTNKWDVVTDAADKLANRRKTLEAKTATEEAAKQEQKNDQGEQTKTANPSQ